MQKILITGITGQDGLFLTSNLLKNKNVSIYGTSRNSSTKLFYKQLSSISNESFEKVKLIEVDLLNIHLVSSLINDIKPNKIFNLTGPSSVYKSINDNRNSYFQIVKIFNNITESVISNSLNSTIFQASSSEMFKATDDGVFNENSELKALTPYAEAKIENHLKAIELSKLHNLNIYSGIMFNHESEFRLPEYLIMNLINKAENILKNNTNKFSVGSLDLVRDWSFAGDVADAMIKISENGKHYSYVIGSGSGRTIESVVKIIFQYFNLNYKDYVDVDMNLNRKNNPKIIVSDPSQIKNELGWEATMMLEDLIIRCIERKPKD
ncbi:GDP-mannose 4,6-dehydratase [Acidimicrobiaceae bacterium]|nr:GDP-mannose 4,6-dehydratase [Acidimicrobiaceae bacterium]